MSDLPPRSRPRDRVVANPLVGPAADRRERRGRGGSQRRRASHSMESVLTEAVALLDESGEQALTFRALADRLGGGVASIYWYVASKDELLDRASDYVLGDVLADAAGTLSRSVRRSDRGPVDAPLGDLRAIAVTLFDAIVERPWLAAYLMRDIAVQPNAMRLYELMGRQLLRLPITPREAFNAVSAVIGFAVGTAADLGQKTPEPVMSGEMGRDEYLARYADQWRALDPDEFPFVHHIVDEFARHDDAEQFRAGLDLLLAGLRLQAER